MQENEFSIACCDKTKTFSVCFTISKLYKAPATRPEDEAETLTG